MNIGVGKSKQLNADVYYTCGMNVIHDEGEFIQDLGTAKKKKKNLNRQK